MSNNEYNQANSDELALTLSEISAQYQLIKKIARRAKYAENTAENIERIILNSSSKSDKIKSRINLERACAKMVAESYSKLKPEFKGLASEAYKNFVVDNGYIIDRLNLEIFDDKVHDAEAANIKSIEKDNWDIIYKARNEIFEKANYYQNDKNLRNWRINELIDEQASLATKKSEIDSANKDYMKITKKNNPFYPQYLKLFKEVQGYLGLQIQVKSMKGKGDFYSGNKDDEIIERAHFPEEKGNKKKKMPEEDKGLGQGLQGE